LKLDLLDNAGQTANTQMVDTYKKRAKHFSYMLINASVCRI